MLALLPCPHIGFVRRWQDGTLIRWLGCSPTVSAGSTRFAGKMYVQEPDCSAGIELNFGSDSVPTCPEGAVLEFEAVVETINGERVLVQPVISGYTVGAPPGPVFMAARSIGGGPTAFDPGVTWGTGLINEGLLIKTAGRVLSQGSDYFLIGDGSEILGGRSPLKVSVARLATGNSISIPPPLCFVAVTGISSKEPDGTGYRAVIRPRSQADVQVMSTN
jgi:hypothetical protein